MNDIFTPWEGYSAYSDDQILEMRKQLSTNLWSSGDRQNDAKEETILQEDMLKDGEDEDYILGLA